MSSIPKVSFNEQDGGLGAVSSTGKRPVAVFGPCSGGVANTPVPYGDVKSLVADNGIGTGVEVAARIIAVYGCPVLFCKTAAATNVGSYGTIVKTGTGTSVITASSSAKPYDSYDVIVKFVTGGTVGTAGITYQWSLDNGATYSQITALGTANTISISQGNVGLALAAGTIVAGDTVSFPTTQPVPTTSEATASLDAMANSTSEWSIAVAAFPVDGAMFDAVDAAIVGYSSNGRESAWIGSFRRKDVGESASAYATAFDTAFSSRSSVRGSIGYADALVVSAVPGRAYQYRRMVGPFAFAPVQAAVTEEVNVAEPGLGALTGVSLVDSNGNLVGHDERITPLGDDKRAVTLRTLPPNPSSPKGVFITRPRTMASAGSDFTLMPYRLVMNIGKEALRGYFTLRLNRVIYVSKTTGYIRERDALTMERAAELALEAVLGGTKPKASAWTVAINRTDNILSTKTINVTARIIPVGYSEYIEIDIGFQNPVITAV